jgi:hypothetical protein
MAKGALLGMMVLLQPMDKVQKRNVPLVAMNIGMVPSIVMRIVSIVMVQDM